MDTPTFNVLALCAGAAGQELGLHLAISNARTVGYLEIDAHPCEVLVSRMEEGHLDEAPVWTGTRTFDGAAWRGVVDCITGGYPCQPFSVAGRRKAEADPRHLWPVIAGIVRDVRPSQCFFENVGNHINLGFYEVARDLQGLGYRVAAGLFTAEEVGSPHRRERLFILADRSSAGLEGRSGERGYHVEELQTPERGCNTLAYAEGFCQREPEYETGSQPRPDAWKGLSVECSVFPPSPGDFASWASVLEQDLSLAPALSEEEAESTLCRVADGMANRMDRLSRCGGGCVPLVAAYAYCCLAASLAAHEGGSIA